MSQAMFLCLLVVVSGRGGIAWLVLFTLFPVEEVRLGGLFVLMSKVSEHSLSFCLSFQCELDLPTHLHAQARLGIDFLGSPDCWCGVPWCQARTADEQLPRPMGYKGYKHVFVLRPGVWCNPFEHAFTPGLLYTSHRGV